jgi:hypothetical protein
MVRMGPLARPSAVCLRRVRLYAHERLRRECARRRDLHPAAGRGPFLGNVMHTSDLDLSHLCTGQGQRRMSLIAWILNSSTSAVMLSFAGLCRETTSREATREQH